MRAGCFSWPRIAPLTCQQWCGGRFSQELDIWASLLHASLAFPTFHTSQILSPDPAATAQQADASVYSEMYL